MIKVELFDPKGNKLTEVNVRTTEGVNGVQWGGVIFFLHKESNQFRAASIVPAIIEKSKK